MGSSGHEKRVGDDVREVAGAGSQGLVSMVRTLDFIPCDKSHWSVVSRGECLKRMSVVASSGKHKRRQCDQVGLEKERYW